MILFLSQDLIVNNLAFQLLNIISGERKNNKGEESATFNFIIFFFIDIDVEFLYKIECIFDSINSNIYENEKRKKHMDKFIFSFLRFYFISFELLLCM